MIPQANSALPGFVRRAAALNEHLPLIVFPQRGAGMAADAARSARACVERYLTQTGCILFRDFSIDGPGPFRQWVMSLGFEQPTSPAGALASGARAPVRDPFSLPEQGFAMQALRVNASARQPLLWLRCASQRYPLEEALVADNREIYRRLSLAVRTRFLSRGLLYERALPASGRLGWSEHFGTSDAREVEAWCCAHRVSFHWRAGELLLRQQQPALIQDRVTGENIWRNSLLSHVLGAHTPAGYERYGLAVRYGDGSPIGSADLENVRAAFEASASVVPLERDDVLLLDPQLLWHAQIPHLLGALRV